MARPYYVSWCFIIGKGRTDIEVTVRLTRYITGEVQWTEWSSYVDSSVLLYLPQHIYLKVIEWRNITNSEQDSCSVT